MQIPAHWRLNSQRYRLEGFRNPDGRVSLRPQPQIEGVWHIVTNGILMFALKKSYGLPTHIVPYRKGLDQARKAA